MDVNGPTWGPKSPGATALHLAAQGGHVKIMDELLERGANIDARTKGACGCKFTLPQSRCLLFLESRVLMYVYLLKSFVILF